jgi:hypothetical protein
MFMPTSLPRKLKRKDGPLLPRSLGIAIVGLLVMIVLLLADRYL